MTPATGAHRLIDELIRTLRRMSAQGLYGFDCSAEARALVADWGKAPEVVPVADTLPKIQSEADRCRRCALWQARARIVFGSGSADAKVMFVGAEPEAEDDLRGEPFSGPAGELLTRVIAAMKLTREAVYLCNLVKCRPPNGRNPSQEEIAACLPFVKRQIAVIAPAVICALGPSAAQALLETQAPLSQLRGRFHDLKGVDFKAVKVMPTHHPAELLRYPEKKRETWADIQQIMGLLKIPV